jgi:hypothetical protein
MIYIGGLVAGERCVVGIDSTGFSLDYNSRHYCLRIKRADKHKNDYEIKNARAVISLKNPDKPLKNTKGRRRRKNQKKISQTLVLPKKQGRNSY